MSDSALQKADFVSVNTQKVVKTRKLPEEIDENVTAVHINGHLFIWVLKEILKRTPNLKRLQVIPSEFCKMTENHLRLLAERGVEMLTGHYQPQCAWREGDVRCIPRHYETERRYLQNLQGPQKALFDEILKYKLTPALMASRYYCLNDEPQVSLSGLSNEFGYVASNVSYPLDMVKGVLHYLNPLRDSSKATRRKASQLKNVLASLKKREAEREKSDKAVRECLEKLGIEELPKNLRPSQYALFEKVFLADKAGLLERALKEKHPRELSIVRERWLGGTILTFLQLGERYEVTCERIRQIEAKAFELVGIV